MFFFGNRLKGEIPSYQLTRLKRVLLKGQCRPSTQEHGQQNYIFSLLREPRQLKCFFWFLNCNYVQHESSHHHPPSYNGRLGNLRNVLSCPTARVLRQQMMKIWHQAGKLGDQIPPSIHCCQIHCFVGWLRSTKIFSLFSMFCNRWYLFSD